MSTTSELTTDEFLDDTDRELLNALQWDFPVDPHAVRDPRRPARH